METNPKSNRRAELLKRAEELKKTIKETTEKLNETEAGTNSKPEKEPARPTEKIKEPEKNVGGEKTEESKKWSASAEINKDRTKVDIKTQLSNSELNLQANFDNSEIINKMRGVFAKKEKTVATPEIPGEKEVKAEIKNLSKEDKEKLGWGLNVIGYKVEKMKDDLFAGVFSLAAKKADKKGTYGIFVNELRNTFVRDSEEANKKGMAIKKGLEKSKFGKLKNKASNAGVLTGNALKYGRIVYDITTHVIYGSSVANPLRYVIAGGMGAARLSEAGKEARLKNEKVVSKTRIKIEQKEDESEKEAIIRAEKEASERAAEEAWELYKNAGGVIGTTKEGKINEYGNPVYDDGTSKSPTAEALNDAYLMNMPKDIQKRLEDPSVANSFMQKFLKAEMIANLKVLEFRTKRINNNEGLSLKEKQEAEKKLFEGYKKSLTDYDRMITQYGTVDEVAMGARYMQIASKGVVLGMQIQTAYKAIVNVPKLWGHLSHFLSFHHGAHEAIVPTGAARNLTDHKPAGNSNSAHETTPTPKGTHTDVADKTPERATGAKIQPEVTGVKPPLSPETPKSLSEIKVDLSSKGFTQTIFDLKAKLLEQYGSVEKMPPGERTFYETPSTKLSQEYGFWDIKKGLSGMGYKGETLSLDSEGHLQMGHFNDNTEILNTTDHKFSGKMFTPQEHHELVEKTPADVSKMSSKEILDSSAPQAEKYAQNMLHPAPTDTEISRAHTLDMETARARVAAAMATHERSLDIEGLKFTETTENGLRIFTHTEKDMIVKMFPDKHVEFYNMKGNLLQSDSTLTVEEIFKMRKLATINTVGNIADANNTPIGRNRELAEQAVESLNKRDDIHEVLTKNMSLVFSNAPKHDGPTLWEYFKDKPASEVLKYTDQINGHTDQGSLKNHLQLLMDSVKKATGKELKLTNFWGRSKTVNEVMEKGLEILKSKGRLEDFEIKVKDSVNK